jgi:hypothetical protein
MNWVMLPKNNKGGRVYRDQRVILTTKKHTIAQDSLKAKEKYK